MSHSNNPSGISSSFKHAWLIGGDSFDNLWETTFYIFFYPLARRSRIFNDSSFQFVRRLLAMQPGTVLQLKHTDTANIVYIYKDDGWGNNDARERKKRNTRGVARRGFVILESDSG